LSNKQGRKNDDVEPFTNTSYSYVIPTLLHTTSEQKST
jgi:hypothetical protein